MGKQLAARNYKQEKDNGQLGLLIELEAIRQEREQDTFDILQLAQIFCFCSLPYRPSAERQISHTARLGDGSTVEVVFTAMRPGVPIAYGNDRMLLYWLVDKAIREETSYIPWEHAAEYLRASKQGDGGKNGKLLRERFRRIASTAITVVRKASGTEEQIVMPIIRRMALPTSISGLRDELEIFNRRKVTLGVQFDDGFVKDFMTHRVPVLRSLVVATQARLQMQDYMFFLIWRSYSAASESVIPWDRLREQFWGSDTNLSRIRLRFREAISLIRTAWPELRAEARPGGLWIAPPQHGNQFVRQLGKPKHIQAKAIRELHEAKDRDLAAAKKRLQAKLDAHQSSADAKKALAKSMVHQLFPNL